MSYWVEAVPVVEGLDLSDDAFELGPGSGLGKPPVEWALLSRTAALREKDSKGVAYRLTAVIGVADSYPFAVDGRQLSQVTMPHGASRLPLAVKAAFLSDLCFSLRRGGRLSVTNVLNSSHARREAVLLYLLKRCNTMVLSAVPS